MLYLQYIFFLVISYLIGSVPFGLIVGKYCHKDLQKLGSGNIGASNAVRILGIKKGGLVFLLDFLKCFASVLAARYFYGQSFAVFCGFAVIFGHIFAVYNKFKGGKGVACLFALYAAINFFLAAFFASCWGLLFVCFEKPFISSIFASIATGAVSYFFCDKFLFFIFIVLTLLIVFKHKANI